MVSVAKKIQERDELTGVRYLGYLVRTERRPGVVSENNEDIKGNIPSSTGTRTIEVDNPHGLLSVSYVNLGGKLLKSTYIDKVNEGIAYIASIGKVDPQIAKIVTSEGRGIDDFLQFS